MNAFQQPPSRRPTVHSLTAVLLSGGQSRRMGSDKATLRVGGEALWSRQLRLLQCLDPEFVCVSARDRPEWCPPEIETIADAAPSRGPLSGITAVMRKARTSHVLALAVDMIQMTVEQASRIWSFARSDCGVIPSHQGRFEPLCAVYPVSAVGLAENALGSGDASLQSFAGALCSRGRARIHAIDSSEARFFANANTPEDLRRFTGEAD